ncbi:MAG: enoyl-CoA hydratase [Neomegalonema sp.]|nr:enoyl-CoA hydratase [Neomegalonema sp.]
MADGSTAAPELAPVLRNEIADGVQTLTLDRPNARNALSEELMGALIATLVATAQDRSVKAVILKGAGPAFCAGHDLKQMSARRADPDRGAAYFQALFAQCSSLMRSIVRLPQPVIAQVHGIASAAGCQLVASCDLAVAADNARFATPGVNIGLFCSTPMVALSRNVAPKHAMEMLLLGDAVSAARAEAMGLVNKVVPEAELESATHAMAEKIVAKSGVAVRYGKPAFYAQAERDLDGAYAYASEVMARNMLEAEAEEGIGAFVEKRAPNWPAG